MIDWIRLLDSDKSKISKSKEQYRNLKKIRSDNYCGIDGFSAERVSESLIDLANENFEQVNKLSNKLSLFRLANLKARNILGYKIYSSIRIILEFLTTGPKKRKKRLDLETIESLLLKITEIKSKKIKFTVNYANKFDFHSPRQAAFKSIKIKKLPIV